MHRAGEAPDGAHGHHRHLLKDPLPFAAPASAATAGSPWAWGDNRWGQLGDGTTTDMLTPVQVSGLTGVTAIAAGILHSLAVSITVTPVNDPPVADYDGPYAAVEDTPP